MRIRSFVSEGSVSFRPFAKPLTCDAGFAYADDLAVFALVVFLVLAGLVVAAALVVLAVDLVEAFVDAAFLVLAFAVPPVAFLVAFLSVVLS